MHTKTGGKTIQALIHRVRRATKQAFRRGEEPERTKSVPYTD